jgi:hypothetical protein
MRVATISLLLGLAAPAMANGNPNPLVPLGKTASTVAVFGDAPYGTTPTDTAEFLATPAFIDAVNADPDVSLVMHVGDIHSGKQYCTQAYDQSIYDLWTAFEDPLVYTPGDNEWADCHKSTEGGNVKDAGGNFVDYNNGNPVDNLALVRSIFFAAPGMSLGQNPRPLLSQAQVPDLLHPSDAKYVENVMWVQSRVVIVAINLPGGSNNDADVWYGLPTATAQQTGEVAERDGANLRWLDLAFTVAQWNQLEGVIIMTQADMWDPEKGAGHLTNYEPYIKNVADHAKALGKSVLLLNGDSHVYQSSNPLTPTNAMHPGYDVPNFHRVVVHGSTFPLEYLKLTIDPKSSAAHTDTSIGPFSWARVIPTLP